MPLSPGTRLGPYEIVAPLGAGGMGEVWRARDPRLGRDVALKLLPAGLAGDRGRLDRLEREARAVAALNHPNIVTLHSIEEAEGRRFLTMELVEGRSLAELIAGDGSGRGLPVARVLDLAVPLADALAAAHARGVIHRDLKPANVMVTREGRVKVLDFGLARTAESEGGVADTIAPGPARAPAGPALSLTGAVLGTGPYMAPEQLRGEPADARSDLFALGIVLYELATGARPFGGNTLADVCSAILRDPAPPLAAARPDAPPDLGRIVARCLEKAPADRFQGARELYDELRLLRRALELAPGQVGGAGPAGPAVRGTGASIAVLPFSNMSADPENEFFSDGLSEELLNALAKVPELKVSGRTSCFAFKGRNEDLRVIGQKLGVATLLEGSVRKAGNRVRITAQLIQASDGFHLWSETYDRVLDDVFAVQDDIAQSVLGALHVKLLGRPAGGAGGATPPAAAGADDYPLILEANQLTVLNTATSLTRAVTLYRTVIARSPADARAWAGLSRAYAYQSFFGYAEETAAAHERAWEAAGEAIALDPRSATAHEVRGQLLVVRSRWREALEELRLAMEIAPGSSAILKVAALFESIFARHDRARELARRAAELDPLNPDIHMYRGRVESFAGNLEGAVEAYRRVRDLSPDMAGVHANLGAVYMELGRLDEALAEVQLEAQPGYRDCILAAVYARMGRRADSDAALARLLTQGPQWAYQFATAHAARGEADEAFRWLERAHEEHDSGLPLVKVSLGFRALHADPRWRPFLERIGLGD